MHAASPRRNSGQLHVCTGGRQHKAQKENGLTSGLGTFLSQEMRAKMPVDRPPTVAKQWIRSGTSKTPAKLYARKMTGHLRMGLLSAVECCGGLAIVKGCGG